MFISGVNDTGKKREKSFLGVGKLISPVSLTPPENLSAVSLTPVNNFSAVSLTPAINFRLFVFFLNGDKLFSGVKDTGEKFIAGVVDTGEQFMFPRFC
jgi:hypothetical protein